MPTYKNTKYEIERREVNGGAQYNYEFYRRWDSEYLGAWPEGETRPLQREY